MYIEQPLIVASDAATNDRFGTSLAIADERTLVVGAPGNNGKAYVFTRQSNGTWLETAILQSSLLSTEFGLAVAVTKGGCRVYVSAPSAFGNGAVYVYKKTQNGYVRMQTLLPTILGVGVFFGVSVRVSPDGTVLAVGNFGAVDPTNVGVEVYVSNGCNYRQSAFINTNVNPLQFTDSMQLAQDGHILAIANTDPNGTADQVIFELWYSCDAKTWVRRQVEVQQGVDGRARVIAINQKGDTIGVGSDNIITPVNLYTR